MSSPFVTSQSTIAELFDKSRIYAFPAFQRPYRWSVDDALLLLDDVSAACLRQDSGYFLGSLVLSQSEGRTQFVIDGRQRLTTLFLLLCVLRDLDDDPHRKASLQRLLWDDVDTIARTEAGWRLRFDASDADFVAQWIAAPGATEKSDVPESAVPERALRMLDVIDAFREALSDETGASGRPSLSLLTDYLLHQCEVIVLTAQTSASGLRLFQVLNNRGLQLSQADLIKPDLLQALPEYRQDEAATIWEGLEDRLGAEHLDILLRSMVFILSGRWESPGRDYAAALKAVMLARGAETFHFEDLPAFGAALEQINWGDLPAIDGHKDPNTLMTGLFILGRTLNEWKEFLPVAMQMAKTFKDAPESLFKHIQALDRTFYVWFINETSEGPRRRVSSEIIECLRRGDDLFAEESPLTVPPLQLDKALAALKTPFPKLYQRGALIRRNELAMCLEAGKPAPQYLERTTAEHILPKNPRPHSKWVETFTPQERRDTIDLLGNGMPLSRDLDKRVGNKDFDDKVFGYVRAGADKYFLSVADVCAYATWTPNDIRERTAQIVDRLTAAWKLL